MEGEEWQNFYQLGGRVPNTNSSSGFTPIGGLVAPGLNPSADYQAAAAGLMNEQAAHLAQIRQNSQFGMNMNTFNSALGGLSSLAQLWQGFQANKLAQDQWKTQKSVLNTNMMNQIQSYNNSLKDRLDTRAKMEGRDQASADAQYEERKAKRY